LDKRAACRDGNTKEDTVFRETLSPNHKIRLTPAMGIFHVVALSIGLIIFTNAFYTGLGIRWPGYIAYVIIGILAVLYVRREMNQWIMAIEEGNIIFLSKTGINEKRLVTMPADLVSKLEPLGDTLPTRPFERFCRIDGPEKPWRLEGKTDTGADCRVVFCPSKKALQALREGTGEDAGE
jgi:hypothetical protein